MAEIAVKLQPGMDGSQRGAADAAERERVLARLAALHRIRERVAEADRPGLLHSISLLIKLETGSLQELELARRARDESW